MSSITLGGMSGDGATVVFDAAYINIDSSNAVTVVGNITPVGGAPMAMTGSPLTAPAVPGANSVYWIIQANLTTGALSIKQATGASGNNSFFPAPDAGNSLIYQQETKSTDGTNDKSGNRNYDDNW